VRAKTRYSQSRSSRMPPPLIGLSNERLNYLINVYSKIGLASPVGECRKNHSHQLSSLLAGALRNCARLSRIPPDVATHRAAHLTSGTTLLRWNSVMKTARAIPSKRMFNSIHSERTGLRGHKSGSVFGREQTMPDTAIFLHLKSTWRPCRESNTLFHNWLRTIP